MFDNDDFELPEDLAAMADAAGAALAGMGDEFAAGAEADAKNLIDYLSRAAKAADNDTFLQEIARAFGIAHDLKGQGSTFGYNLVTEIAEHLCVITRPQSPPTRDNLPRMQACAQGIYDILVGRIVGNGEEIGARLRADLGIS